MRMAWLRLLSGTLPDAIGWRLAAAWALACPRPGGLRSSASARAPPSARPCADCGWRRSTPARGPGRGSSGGRSGRATVRRASRSVLRSRGRVGSFRHLHQLVPLLLSEHVGDAAVARAAEVAEAADHGGVGVVVGVGLRLVRRLADGDKLCYNLLGHCGFLRSLSMSGLWVPSTGRALVARLARAGEHHAKSL